MKVFCTLTKEQASLYAAVVEEADEATRRRPRASSARGMILATLTKLKQVCNHPAQFLGDNSALPGRSGKLARLTEMLEEVLEAGDRALVFTQFAEMGEHPAAPPAGDVRPRGAVPARRRAAAAARPDGRALPGRRRTAPRRVRPVAEGRRHRAEPDGAPTTSSTSTAGGTRRSRTRRPTAPSASARRGTCRSTSSSASGTLEEKIDEMIERKKRGSPRGWSAPARAG